ncbi:MAG TPA: GntR family transcriptional regulator [Candidatus Baltobacteraceae bacterium]|nr:GntR family transcriptional regulator [Candidatus Baltobacteraceae bacterium]
MFRPGLPRHQQIVYAAQKAIVSGQLRPGDTFPSVRALSRELKINPNTAHKVVTQLADDGLLETRPGLGTVVATLPEATSSQRTQLLGDEIEELVVDAKRLGIDLQDVLASVSDHWKQLGAKQRPEDKSSGSGKR